MAISLLGYVKLGDEPKFKESLKNNEEIVEENVYVQEVSENNNIFRCIKII